MGMVCFVRDLGMKHQEIRHIVITAILQELQLLNASPYGCGPGAFYKVSEHTVLSSLSWEASQP